MKNKKLKKNKEEIGRGKTGGGVLFFMVVEPTDFGEESQQVIAM